MTRGVQLWQPCPKFCPETINFFVLMSKNVKISKFCTEVFYPKTSSDYMEYKFDNAVENVRLNVRNFLAQKPKSLLVWHVECNLHNPAENCLLDLQKFANRCYCSADVFGRISPEKVESSSDNLADRFLLKSEIFPISVRKTLNFPKTSF